MGKFTLRFALFGFLVGMCVLYGIEMATSGIEQIQGPLSSVQQQLNQLTEQPDSAANKPASETQQEAEPVVQPEPQRLPLKNTGKEPSVDVLADHTANVLQSVSSSGIRFIVSIFDAITQ